jgi:type IV pilus assembly protein PilE
MTYTIDQDGTKATANVPTGWSKPSPNTCWARDKAGDC